jgi:hypothetical protein
MNTMSEVRYLPWQGSKKLFGLKILIIGESNYMCESYPVVAKSVEIVMATKHARQM